MNYVFLPDRWTRMIYNKQLTQSDATVQIPALELLPAAPEIESINVPEILPEKELEIVPEKEPVVEIPFAVPLDVPEIVTGSAIETIPQQGVEEILPKDVPAEQELQVEAAPEEVLRNGEGQTPLKKTKKTREAVKRTDMLFSSTYKKTWFNKSMILTKINDVILFRKQPKFQPMEQLWFDFDESILEVIRAPEDVESERASAKSISLGATKRSSTSESRSTVTPIAPTTRELMEIISEPQLTPRKRPRETFSEEFPPAGQEAFGLSNGTPKKRRKVVTVEEVQASEGLIPKLAEENVASVELPTAEETFHGPVPEEQVTSENWMNDIMKIIIDENIKLKPVDVCNKLNKRLTRRNMAKLFNFLLSLAKGQYVSLYSAENSCELEFIMKGPQKYYFI